MTTRMKNKPDARQSRHARIRSRVSGTAQRPRLSIYKSNRYIHAQLVDDEAGRTLIALSTKAIAKGTKTESAKALGAELAKLAKARDLSKVVFDRGGFRYTGRITAVAEGAREAGLSF